MFYWRRWPALTLPFQDFFNCDLHKMNTPRWHTPTPRSQDKWKGILKKEENTAPVRLKGWLMRSINCYDRSIASAFRLPTSPLPMLPLMTSPLQTSPLQISPLPTSPYRSAASGLTAAPSTTAIRGPSAQHPTDVHHKWLNLLTTAMVTTTSQNTLFYSWGSATVRIQNTFRET